MRALERLPLIHIVASPAALDSASWPEGAIVLRVASDEVLAVADKAPELPTDPHAVVLQDFGFSGVWLDAAEAEQWISRSCEWEPPSERPAFAQGAMAGLPVKLWLERDRVLVVVPSPYATDLVERMS